MKNILLVTFAYLTLVVAVNAKNTPNGFETDTFSLKNNFVIFFKTFESVNDSLKMHIVEEYWDTIHHEILKKEEVVYTFPLGNKVLDEASQYARHTDWHDRELAKSYFVGKFYVEYLKGENQKLCEENVDMRFDYNMFRILAFVGIILTFTMSRRISSLKKRLKAN